MRSTIASLLIVFAVASAGSAQTASKDDANEAQSGLIDEPRLLEKWVSRADQLVGQDPLAPRDGFYPEMGNMITGNGWISAGPGYRQHFWDGRGLVDASTAISWRAYKMAQARFQLMNLANKHLTLGSQGRWQDLTQVNYFGIGSDSIEEAHSQYRLRDTNIVGYAMVKVNRWLNVAGTFGRLQHLSLLSPAGSFLPGYADALVSFSGDPGMDVEPNYLHGDVSVTADTRDSASRPRAGGLYRAGAEAYSDRDFSQYSFRRYEVEGLQFVPVAGHWWILAFHGWGVFSDTSDGHMVPFYMAPSLGGTNTLRGYHNYRFHDRNLLLANAESRWALIRHIDLAAFFDAGNVAARPGDLTLHKTSWGAGVRLHSRRSTLLRADVGRSGEGFRVYVSMTDSFRLKRLDRLTAEAPFVP
jgi:surface antigen Omp85-like protein